MGGRKWKWWKWKGEGVDSAKVGVNSEFVIVNASSQVDENLLKRLIRETSDSALVCGSFASIRLFVLSVRVRPDFQLVSLGWDAATSACGERIVQTRDGGENTAQAAHQYHLSLFLFAAVLTGKTARPEVVNGRRNANR
jgi:hypothetical protein